MLLRFSKFLKEQSRPNLALKKRLEKEAESKPLPGHRDEDKHLYDTLSGLNLDNNHYGFPHGDKISAHAVASYTLNAYRGVNDYLRNPHAYKDMDNTHKDKLIHHIKNAIAQHSAPRDMVVYTGLPHSPERYQKFKRESIHVHFPSFKSTSLDSSIAKGFSNLDEKHPHTFVTKKTYGKDESQAHKIEHHELNSIETYADRLNLIKKHFPEYDEDDYHPDVSYGVSNYEHVLKIHVPKGAKAKYVQPFSAHKCEEEILLSHGAKVRIKPTPTYDHKSGHVVWTGHLIHDGFNHTSYYKDTR